MAALREAARRFFPRPHQFLPLGESPGYSESLFARVETAEGAWCLRRWPPREGEAALRFMHQALRYSRARGVAGVPALAATPEGDTLLALDGAFFEAQGWMAGRPLAGEPLDSGARGGRSTRVLPNRIRTIPLAYLRELAGGLARFHRSTIGLQPAEEAQRLPLLRQMLEAVEEMADLQGPLRDAIRARARGVEREIALRWLALLPRAIELAAIALEARLAVAGDASTLCHGDLWPAHVFFADGAFSGFVDFQHLAFSAPAFDLAQLILHFNGWQMRQAALDAYRAELALGSADEAVLPIAAILDLKAEAYWSLTALYHTRDDRLHPACREAHLDNLWVLLAELELVMATLDTELGEDPDRAG
jgi:Ser/Thr protein kinase RdoA (MazF antagonist)